MLNKRRAFNYFGAISSKTVKLKEKSYAEDRMYVCFFSTTGDPEIFRSDKYLTSYIRDTGIDKYRSRLKCPLFLYDTDQTGRYQ